MAELTKEPENDGSKQRTSWCRNAFALTAVQRQNYILLAVNAELKFVQEAAQDDQPGKLEAVNGLQRTIKSIKENIQRLEQEQKKVVTYDIPGLLESN